MKIKLEIETNGVVEKRMAEKNNIDGVVSLSYLEQPGVRVLVEFNQDYIKVMKTGNINLSIKHIVKETIDVEYKIKNSDTELFGSTNIETVNYMQSDNIYQLEYIANDEKIVQRWMLK